MPEQNFTELKTRNKGNRHTYTYTYFLFLQLFVKLCHLSNSSNASFKQFNKEYKNLTEFFASFESNVEIDNLKPKPVVIIDTKLPIPDKIFDFLQNKSTFGFKSFNPFTSFSDPSSDTVQRFISRMEELNIAAKF